MFEIQNVDDSVNKWLIKSIRFIYFQFQYSLRGNVTSFLQVIGRGWFFTIVILFIILDFRKVLKIDATNFKVQSIFFTWSELLSSEVFSISLGLWITIAWLNVTQIKSPNTFKFIVAVQRWSSNWSLHHLPFYIIYR